MLRERTLEDTGLYRRLLQIADSGSPVPGNVRDLCEAAAARLKFFCALHKQYTLHDDVHCLRVVVLAEYLLQDRIDELNVVEVALLILAAYYHDQGMIVEPAENAAIVDSDEWRLHDAEWSREHPNRAELLARIADPLLAPDDRTRVSRAVADLEAACFTDYVRQTHGQRSAELIRRQLGSDSRAVINGRNTAELLAKICHSHVLPATQLLDISKYRLDELVGTERVNVGFLAMVLRLADVLDFDRDRTPDGLYRAIDFTSAVSLKEWEKHRSVVGWEISPNRIAFAAECSHPAYERAIRQFLAAIETELKAAQEWSRRLPTMALELTRFRGHLLSWG